MMFENITPEVFWGIAFPIIIGVLGFRWYQLKHRIAAFRKLVVAVDDALIDDKVDEAEFRKIWAEAYNLIKGAKPNA